jgi:hypothetical protein
VNRIGTCWKNPTPSHGAEKKKNSTIGGRDIGLPFTDLIIIVIY